MKTTPIYPNIDQPPIILKYSDGFYICGDFLGGIHWDCPKCFTGTISHKQTKCGHCGQPISLERVYESIRD